MSDEGFANGKLNTRTTVTEATTLDPRWTWEAFLSSMRLRGLHEAAHAVVEECVKPGSSDGAFINTVIPDADQPSIVGGSAPWYAAGASPGARAIVALAGSAAEMLIGGRDSFTVESDAGDAQTLGAAKRDAQGDDRWVQACGDEAIELVRKHAVVITFIGAQLVMSERISGDLVRYIMATFAASPDSATLTVR